MPVQQILAGDRSHGSVLRNAGVGIVFAVGDDDALAMNDGADVIVAAGDGGVHLGLGELQLVVAELGIVQQVEVDLEDGVEVALETVERDAGGVRLIVGLDLGGVSFEEVVHLVAGFGLGSTGAPDFAVEIGESGLVGGLGDGASTNAGGGVDQRKLVVGLQEDDHAVRELHASRFWRSEGR